MSGRSAHARAILGPALFEQLTKSKILLVGAGGIGCELIKNVVLTGFGDITLLDLDTIDLSNLNRQFLFRKKDIKQSKALTAAATAGPFNPEVRITPIHGNIKDEEYDVVWFSQFDIVLNALDNLDARTHVNKMCQAAGVPLVESGTAGYLGQVQPIIKGTSECFSCSKHETPKTFPVCTIRSTPSQPIHCIVWAKSYLMSQLFAEDEDASGSSSELDEALKQGENAQEIATLKAEAQAFARVRQLLREPSQDGGANAARLVFDKIFNNDIRNLLKMDDMWRSRARPTPLDWDSIFNETFQLPGASSTASNGTAPPAAGSRAVEQILTNGEPSKPVDAAKLKDQKVLTLRDNLELFVDSTKRLSARLQAMIAQSNSQAEPTISFDKDDPDTLDFVTAASNLRSAAYNIQQKTRWEIKEMAGNIIPAIATTNAIVSGLIVMQALHILAGKLRAKAAQEQEQKKAVFDSSKIRVSSLLTKSQNPICSISIAKPSPACGVCQDTYTTLQCDPSRTTLGDVVNGVLGEEEDLEVSTFEGARMLSDPDWDDNLSRTLESLGVTRGKFLTIVDDSDGDEQGTIRGTIQLSIAALPDGQTDPAFILPDPLPSPPRKTKPSLVEPAPAPSPTKMTLHKAGTKRRAPDDDTDSGNTPSKKRKTSVFSSPKKKALEDDGLVILDGEDDDLDHMAEDEVAGPGDVIEID